LIFIKCDCDLITTSGIQKCFFGNTNNNVVENDKRDKTFSKKYTYNPILELDEKISKDEESYTYHDVNEEYEIESSDSDVP
jgi:hypothetical protein